MCVIHLHARHALERTPARITNRHFERSEKNVSHRPKIFIMVQPPMEASKAVRKLCWFQRKKINR
jgi:hypothetical protein